MQLYAKTKKSDLKSDLIMVAGVGFEPHDLRVMSPTSYLAAPSRDMINEHSIYYILCVVKTFLLTIYMLNCRNLDLL